jgi:integrase
MQTSFWLFAQATIRGIIGLTIDPMDCIRPGLKLSAMGKNYNHEFDNYICVNAMGDLIQPDYVTDVFPKLLAKHKLKKIRFHDLRHSCATLLLNLGFSMKEIQEWLGHSDFQITAKTYAHVDYKNKIAMMDKVSNTLCS